MSSRSVLGGRKDARRGGSLRVGHGVGENARDKVDNTVPAQARLVSNRSTRLASAVKGSHLIGMSARMILAVELPDLT